MNTETFQLVNMCNHEIHLYSKDMSHVLKTIQPGVNEIEMSRNQVVIGTALGVPVYEQQFEFANLPPKRDGVLLIVPFVMQQALFGIRDDLISPDVMRHGVKDNWGSVIGVTGFVKLGQTFAYQATNGNGHKPAPVVPPPPPPPDPIESEWAEIKARAERVTDLMDFPGAEMYLKAASCAGRDLDVYVWFEQPKDGKEGYFIVREIQHDSVIVETAPGVKDTQRLSREPKDARIAYSSPAKLMKALEKHQPDFRKWSVYRPEK